ncbi:MAG: xanthine dehydrogenase family protein molybdopterin-binding subunit, partial [Nitrospinota bacterium]
MKGPSEAKSSVGTAVRRTAVRRKEDRDILVGEVEYTGDIHLPGMLHAGIFRSPYAHARLKRVDLSKALELPGVIIGMTGKDLPAYVMPLAPFPFQSRDPFQGGNPSIKFHDHYCLVKDRVRFSGEPVAAVVAADKYVAEDALDLIEAEFEPLPPVLDAEAALEPGSPLLYDEWGDNLMLRFRVSGGDVERAFQEADVVIEEKIYSSRFTSTPIETRVVMARYDAGTDLLEVWDSTQIPHVISTLLQKTLDIPHLKVRVISRRVGGGFGQKWGYYPEETLIPVLAMKAGRPVRWIETRSEHMVATSHAREQVHSISAAVKKDGTILGVTDRIIADVGTAYPVGGLASIVTSAMYVPGAYKISNYRGELFGVVTNKTPFGAHRGFGKSEAAYAIERLVSIIAHRLNLDPAEIRLKNFVPPEDFPYVSVTGTRYDSGNYAEALKKALKLADYEQFRKRQEELRKEGTYLGIGVALVIEPSSSARKGSYNAGYYSVSMRMDPAGPLYVFTGGNDEGQGHATAISQLVSQELGIDFADVHVVEGDTLRCPYGSGSYSSRFAIVGASAAIMGARKLREKAVKIAAAILDAPDSEISLAEGFAFCASDPARRVSLREIAHTAYLAIWRLPEGMDPGLDITYHYRDPNVSFETVGEGRVAMFSSVPYDAIVAVVEVDRETMEVKILRYVSVHDCGVMLNPAIVEGQHRGAMLHGLGGALYEELIYNEEGQLLNGNFKDYFVPTTMEVPPLILDNTVTPNPFTPGGFKGSGETGTVGPPPALANAVEDALRPFGVRIRDLPLSPHYLWEIMKQAP